MDDPYAIEDGVPSPERFAELRETAGMTARSVEAIERGLPNTLYGAIAIHEPTDETVGMGRIVGDDGSVYHVCDMAVHPDHQGRGLGTRMMEAIESYIEETAPPTAYVNLMADVDGFYENFGYEETRPASKGMYRRVED